MAFTDTLPWADIETTTAVSKNVLWGNYSAKDFDFRVQSPMVTAQGAIYIEYKDKTRRLKVDLVQVGAIDNKTGEYTGIPLDHYDLTTAAFKSLYEVKTHEDEGKMPSIDTRQTGVWMTASKLRRIARGNELNSNASHE